MSLRALKRLERLKNLEQEEVSDPSNESTDEESVKANVFNPFDALGGDNDSEPEANEESVNENAQQEVKSTQKSKKKKPKSDTNKKKTKSSKKNKDIDSDEEFDKLMDKLKSESSTPSNAKLISKDEEDDNNESDDLEDYYNEQFNVQNIDDNFSFFTSSRMKEAAKILSIKNLNDLDPDSEFRNLLGKLSNEAINDANSTTAFEVPAEVMAQYKRLARLTRGWGGKDRRGVPGTTRKLLFTRIKDDWLPTSKKSVGMDELNYNDKFNLYSEEKIKSADKAGLKFFKFTMNKTAEERVANARFYASVVMTSDPDSLIQSVKAFPYHVESLLQVAMILLRQGGDKSISNAFVDRALFVFDRSLHKSFHELISSGDNGLIRLPYEVFMNRQFYLCLFRFINVLGERSTFFTALTYSKLLLSLDPELDPMGVRYFIDFYAIMSENYEWFIKFAESSLVTTYLTWFTPGIAFSLPLAYLRLGNRDKAIKALERAFLHYRFLSFKLLEDIGLSKDLPKDEKTPSSAEVLEAQTYLIRAAILWKDQSERQFLHDELSKLFTKNKIAKESFFSKSWIPKSANDDNFIPLNLIRFAILSGESKIMAAIPQTVWDRDDLYEYDILPPSSEATVYNEFGGTTGQKVSDRLLDHVDQNLLYQFIQTSTANDDLEETINRLQLEDENNQQG